MQQQPEVRKKQTEGISNNLEAFTTKMTRSSSKNQEVPVSCDFLNRDRTREQRRIPHCKPCNGRSSRKCHSQTQTIPSKKASAGNCLPMPSLPNRKRLPTVTDASVYRHDPRRPASPGWDPPTTILPCWRLARSTRASWSLSSAPRSKAKSLPLPNGGLNIRLSINLQIQQYLQAIK